MKFKAKDFNAYQNAIDYYLQLFGIGGWEITYKFGQLEGETWAQVVYDADQRKACFMMNNGNTPDYDLVSPKECALHEVTHLLLGILADMAKRRSYNDDLYDSEEHCVINRVVGAFRKLQLI